MDAKVYELLNDQINKELYSAYLYLDMANFYADKGLAGFQNWFTIQAQEERDHAMLMLQYLHNNGQHVELKAIAKPDKEFKDLMDPLKMALEHEEYVTSLINGIYAAASEVKDYRTLQFLDWFVKELLIDDRNPTDGFPWDFLMEKAKSGRENLRMDIAETPVR